MIRNSTGNNKDVEKILKEIQTVLLRIEKHLLKCGTKKKKSKKDKRQLLND